MLSDRRFAAPLAAGVVALTVAGNEAETAVAGKQLEDLNRGLRAPTDRRIHTLLPDAQYRVALAWQNTAYNQPPHPSFFLSNGMSTPPRPKIHLR
ncbi:rhamnogalacturonan lyase family protein [Crossiella sp. NPDC003009]